MSSIDLPLSRPHDLNYTPQIAFQLLEGVCEELLGSRHLQRSSLVGRPLGKHLHMSSCPYVMSLNSMAEIYGSNCRALVRWLQNLKMNWTLREHWEVPLWFTLSRGNCSNLKQNCIRIGERVHNCVFLLCVIISQISIISSRHFSILCLTVQIPICCHR